MNSQVKEISTLNEKTTKLHRQLKILYAVIRTPKLCDLFHRAERRRLTEKHIQDADKEAYLSLRQYKVNENNAEKFIENLAMEIFQEMKDNKAQL